MTYKRTLSIYIGNIMGNEIIKVHYINRNPWQSSVGPLSVLYNYSFKRYMTYIYNTLTIEGWFKSEQ